MGYPGVMAMTTIKLDPVVRDRLNAEARREGVPVGRVLESMLDERARSRRFAALKAAVDATPAPLLASHAAESERWSATDEDGLARS